ncbi:MAG TPA: hypothetical protein VFQ72_00800 [Candidatus Paceibacterota bacterium]|nr:hypothetical protein [Candidatus Paceibacterota bacterium]
MNARRKKTDRRLLHLAAAVSFALAVLVALLSVLSAHIQYPPVGDDGGAEISRSDASRLDAVSSKSLLSKQAEAEAIRNTTAPKKF